ncbi:DUF3320 domain-containing protein [Xanthomonas sp. NCPPB 2632]|uniref:DUF3320 domain-containing protein n=1 Tax=Xanthomonas sp. NCPPB 2632 TaxID=3240912 RepID=UPI0035116D19
MHEPPTGILAQLEVDVVRIEGPVHTDEVIVHIRDAWGAKRAGSRIQEAVEKTSDVAVRQNYVMQDGCAAHPARCSDGRRHRLFFSGLEPLYPHVAEPQWHPCQ